ncbi:MAG: glycosyltransferase [Acidobacteria bacterium]|nr:glycosyltransferase [Acidobacteriota bacterium]
MIRVLHVGKFYPPHAGGMERVLETICRASQGFVENHVLVLNGSSRTVQERRDGVHVTRVASIGSIGSVHVAPGFARRLARTAADLIVLHEPNPWALLSYAIARPGPPLFIWYHSDVVRPALQYALFYAPLARVAYARAQRIIVSSPPLGEYAAVLTPYRDRVRVVPFGIEPSRWRSHAGAGPSGEPFVLFAGRHVAYKGVDVLLRALAQSTARAVIVGDGPKRRAWEAMARGLGLNGRATFTGEVPDDELRRLMHACAALVLPSVTRAEAFGYVQLEAMAAGKPVISTDVPSGVSWVNQHMRTGLIVPSGDDRALRAAIDRLMADSSLRDRLGAAGRARVEQEFTLERLRDRLRTLYEEGAVVPQRPAAC